jgi:hypothetical protein
MPSGVIEISGALGPPEVTPYAIAAPERRRNRPAFGCISRAAATFNGDVALAA